MDIKTEYFKIERNIRYATYGTLSEKTKYFWFALHGSNMVCEQVIYKFKDFDPEEHFIVAPEAYNRFYKTGFGGDVVGAWMTKRDRLYEIDDIAHYLNRLYTSYKYKLSPNVKTTILAFSQGGTMAFRWLHRLPVVYDQFIAYSCWIPEEIDLKASATQLNQTNMVFTYGLQDVFLTQDRMEQVQAVINKNELNIKMETYEGEHKIDKAQLLCLFEKFIK